MKIGIRADSGKKTGMGHIMRCLTLAQEFRAAGHVVFFICNDRAGRGKIVEYGFMVLNIDTNSEESALTKIIHQMNLDCLIVDSYEVDREYFLSLKKAIQLLCYIDDLNQFVYPVDILINGNFAAEAMEYRNFAPGELMLLGCVYNLIRKEFHNLPPGNVKPKIEHILITMGAADPVNFSSRLVREIRQVQSLNSIQLDVIVGGNNPFNNDLLRLSEEYPNIRLYHNVERMSEPMRLADLAISAGGSTLYELCACGTPTLSVIISDNQQYIVTKLAEAGYIISLGWYDRVDFHGLPRTIERLDADKRRVMALQGPKLVDGQGPMRVRTAIEEYYHKRYEKN